MKILVTGSNGQVGREIQVLSKTIGSWQFHFHDVDTLDITDNEQVKSFFDSIKPDVCINAAAYTAVDKAESDEEAAALVNTTAPGIIAENCQTHNTKLVHFSTDFVYDGNRSSPYKETVTPNPLNVYAKTKLAGDREVMRRCEQSVILRTCGVYSPFGQNFVKTIIRLGRKSDQLTVVYDQVITPTYARDIAQAIFKIIPQLSSPEVFGLYHFSNEGITSWYDIAVAVMHLAGINCEILPIETHQYPTPAKRPVYSVLHKGKIKETFGLSINHWRKSLEECLEQID